MREFAALLVKIIKPHPCWKEAEILSNLEKPNQNAQVASLYLWWKRLGGGLLI